MGLFSSIRKVAKRVVKRAAPAAIQGFAAGGPAAALGAGAIATIQPRGTSAAVPPSLFPTFGAGGLPAIPGIPTARSPRFTRALPRPPGGGLPIIPGQVAGGCPAGFHPAKDHSGRCVRNRRMNPLNPRAARRAIRRIKGAMKMLRQIERQLPKQRVRRAPTGHRARLTHQ